MGFRRGSDPPLLWLWHRPTVTALIQPIAWEPPYASGVAPKKQTKKKLRGVRSRHFELRVRHGFFKAWAPGYIALHFPLYLERMNNLQEVAKVIQSAS